MKQKDFNKLNLVKGQRYVFKFRSLKREDNKIYTGAGYYSGQSDPVTDTNIFKEDNWSNDFFMVKTRQIISIS